MNTYSTNTYRAISARFLASITIVSLLLSALPVAFLVATAASTGIELNKTADSVLVNQQVNFVVSRLGSGGPTAGTFVAFSDGGNGGNFFDGTAGGACNSVTPDVDAKLAIGNNKGVCYSNSTPGVYDITVQLLTGIDGTNIGDPVSIEITVTNEIAGVVEDKKVDICHWHQNGFNAIEVSVNSILGAHGNDTEDIIPVIAGIYPNGQNLTADYNGATGAEVLASDCVVPRPLQKTSELIVVTGDNLDFGTGLGWLFNRDVNTATPFEFNDDVASIGDGALYVPPISDVNPLDKFVAENFIKLPVEDFLSIGYDFNIAGVDADDDVQFYLNVYVNIDNSNNYYDCRFDFVPTVGAVGSFTSVTFEADDTPVNVTKRLNRIPNCPATIAEMPAGSYIPFFALSVGDTSASDKDVSGYYDKVILDTVSKITTYDFEPAVIYGCLDEEAINYNPEATYQGEVRCEYPEVVVNTCILPSTSGNQEEFMIGTSSEPSLASILSGSGFGGVDVELDQIDTEVWSFGEASSTKTTFKVTVLANYAGNSQLYGYYQAGNSVSLTPLFKLGSHSGSATELVVGDSIIVEVPNNGAFGFAIGTEGYDTGIWYSEPSLNQDGADNLAVYNPISNTYLLAFEDQLNGDRDFNDLVLKIDEINCSTEVDSCSLEAVSDTGTVVVENSKYALETWEHPAWTAVIPGAKWIWEAYKVINPTVSETKTFRETFTVNGVNNAFLSVGADNSYQVYVNGNLVKDETNINNFKDFTQDNNIDLTSFIVDGQNTLDIKVTNLGVTNSTPENNPAGLLYKLVVNAETHCELTTYVNENPDPEYAPYCGDGVVNQEWEQCETGELCTDYCTFNNQCTDLQLVQINLNETNSTSFDGTLHLGAAGNIIPNGTWFNFNEVGDDSFQSIANEVDGLAITRDLVNSRLGLAFVGGNSPRQLDIVAGTIKTVGIDLGTVNRSPNPQFKLENGEGGSFADIFAKDSNNGIDFDLRADTGNDGVTVVIGAGEEYNCQTCKAEVEARVVIRDEEGAEVANNGTGNLLPQVILGDGSVVPFGTWFKLSEAANPGDSAEWINDPETVTNYTDAYNKAGLFVSREGNGMVKVALYGFHNPGGNANYESLRATIEFNDAKVLADSTKQIPGDYKLENHSEVDAINSNDNFDSFVEADDLMSVDFDFWVDTKADGITITLDKANYTYCEDDTEPNNPENPNDDNDPETYTIDGFKYEVDDEVTTPRSNWVINLTDEEGTILTSTTTNQLGYYSFEVEEGYYRVYEEMQTNWNQVNVEQNDYSFNGEVEYCSFDFYPFEYEGFAIDSQVLLDEYDYEGRNECNFYNTFTGEETTTDPVDPVEPQNNDNNTQRRSSSSGTRVSQAAPQGLVLGATTSSCPFLLDFMQIGIPNNSWEVTKLQLFLNIFVAPNSITGIFDQTTDANVKTFQETYRSEVLDPWFKLGIVPHNRPTGFVYKTTLWKINSIICPDYAITPVFEGEDLNSNVNID